MSVQKSEIAYKTHLVPLLRYAKTLELIDPYLDPNEKRYAKMISLCSQLIGSGRYNSSGSRIHFHTQRNVKRADWELLLRPFMTTYGHNFVVFVWRRLDLPRRMHNRCILTDQCGIGVQYGLDISHPSKASTDQWSFYNEEVKRDVLAQYNPLTSSLTLENQLAI